MPVERRGQAIRVMINLVNWQQEEPTGSGGGRQLSMDGTSRVNREVYARFCERLGVKLPGPTRLVSRMRERRNAVPEMKEDPSEPAYRRRLQTTVSCCRPMAVVVNVTEKA